MRIPTALSVMRNKQECKVVHFFFSFISCLSALRLTLCHLWGEDLTYLDFLILNCSDYDMLIPLFTEVIFGAKPWEKWCWRRILGQQLRLFWLLELVTYNSCNLLLFLQVASHPAQFSQNFQFFSKVNVKNCAFWENDPVR